MSLKIRRKDSDFTDAYNPKELKFEESTYYLSSGDKEQQFLRAQFPDPEKMALYKKYRKEWHRRAESLDAGHFPLAVICELVSICNLKCNMCYTRKKAFQDSIIGTQRMMPWELVTKIIDECVEIGVYSILFSWRGESSLYKSRGKDGNLYDFADVLQYARNAGILEITSLTNGRLMNKELIIKIVDAQPNWLSFSVDGLNETYGKIRKGDNDDLSNAFAVVTNNISEIVRYRTQKRYSMPQIRTNSIYPAISKAPKKYLRYMEKLGVGLVTINEMLDYRFKNLPDNAVLDNFFCQYPFQRLAVSANGIIMPCPGAHLEDEEIALGRYVGSKIKKVINRGKKDVIEHPEITLKEAYNSDKIEWIRDFHRAGRRKEILTCKYCRHGAKKYGVTWIPDEWDMNKMEWIGRNWRNA